MSSQSAKMTEDLRCNEISAGSQVCPSGNRFTLKKRSIRGDEKSVNISSYNSDFLDGLFADVAKASFGSEPCSSGKRCSNMISVPDEAASSHEIESFTSKKKSRISLRKCLSRAQTSTMDLSCLDATFSPKGINELYRRPTQSGMVECSRHSALNHQDSLQFQLNCVSEQSDSYEDGPKRTDAKNAVFIAFPNLPATVSDSSCHAGLTRVNLVRHASIPENSFKESFGWFVDLDDNKTVENPNLPYAVSSDSLAFQAPTAPKRVNDDAELEWAQAADTVDDVLGDFF